MKSEIHGKRFSKEKTVSISSNDHQEDILKFGEHIANTPSTQWETFDNKVLHWSERAVTILKENNLPQVAHLHWVDGSEKWQTERPKNYKTSLKSSFLSAYVINDLGYAKDSPEGLAARIITTIDQIKIAKGKGLLLLIFQFGELSKLYDVYYIETNQNKKNASKSRKKQWAVKLAEHLVNIDHIYTFNKYWNLIEDEDDDEADLHIYRSGNKLIYDKGTKREHITQETFRTEYIAEAKKTSK